MFEIFTRHTQHSRFMNAREKGKSYFIKVIYSHKGQRSCWKHNHLVTDFDNSPAKLVLWYYSTGTHCTVNTVAQFDLLLFDAFLTDIFRPCYFCEVKNYHFQRAGDIRGKYGKVDTPTKKHPTHIAGGDGQAGNIQVRAESNTVQPMWILNSVFHSQHFRYT